MSSPKQLARIAGVFYLLVGIFGGFAEGFVDPKLHVAGNAAGHSWERRRERRTRPHGRRRPPGGRGLLRPDGDGPVPLAEPRSEERSQVDGDLRGDRGRHDLPQRRLPVRGHAGRNRPVLRDRLRGGWIERSRDDPAGHPALRHAGRSSLLRPLARAARVSRLPIRAVPKALGVVLRAGHQSRTWRTRSRRSCFPTSSCRSSRS